MEGGRMMSNLGKNKGGVNRPFSMRISDHTRNKFSAIVAISQLDHAVMLEEMINKYAMSLPEREQKAYFALLELYEAQMKEMNED